MNEKVIELLQILGFNENTTEEKIERFLSCGISEEDYISITGKSIQSKVNNILKYLSKSKIKKDLNLVIADDKGSLEYIEYLSRSYNVIVHKTEEVKDVSTIDLVLFTGGEDVNPKIYGENVGKFTCFNSSRDDKEFETFLKFKNKTPLLGICRGAQFLTVVSGGKLIQDVTGHEQDHYIVFNSDLKLKITSSHHQMMNPFEMREEDYKLIAHSEYFKSTHYYDGNDKNIELNDNFLEPEIVYYTKQNALCIQGHPEWSNCNEDTKRKCLILIDEYLLKNKNPNIYFSNKFKNIKMDEYIDQEEDNVLMDEQD